MTAAPTLADRLALVPLLPIAAATTAGIVIDHFVSPALACSLAAVAVGVALWIAAGGQRSAAALALGWGGLAAAYHHEYLNHSPVDDVAGWATTERRLVRLRGRLDEEPFLRKRLHNDPLVSVERPDQTTTVLDVEQINDGGDWTAASGRVRLMVEGKLDDLHAGDEVEAFGWLALPHPPLNPGEWDYAERLRMDRVRAELYVRKSEASVVRLAQGWRGSLFGWLGVYRGWCQRTLQDNLPPDEAPVAMALLLGDGAPMTQSDWDRYIRTGVIHVLAISGQHLVVLSGFVWVLCRLVGFRRRQAALLVALGLLGYALLTGARPSAMRAAVMVGVFCGGIIIGRRTTPANTFALAWLLVLALNPTDLFTAGFQLSFLAVAVLLWGMPHWFGHREENDLDRLVDESRPFLLRCLRNLGQVVLHWYLITLILTIATAPLVIYWQHVISPAALLIGPPVILLSAIALVFGFLFLLLAPLIGVLAVPCAWMSGMSLAGCDGIVGFADRLPGACWYVGTIPVWWLVGFYAIGIAWLASPFLLGPARDQQPADSASLPALRRLRWPIPAVLAAWACVGLLTGAARPAPDEVRVTFLAVGHGNCTVLETEDGRCILYDAGALAGPDVTRRQVAPFLWSRGIRRIDELILSHADLDHFNGVPGLLERFSVGQITVTPSFADKASPGVAHLVHVIHRQDIPLRIAHAGDRIVIGGVEMDVLHPPATGPDGPENVRSMVLLVRHLGHTILLTGDLEKEGLDMVLTMPPPAVDVMMAPHHGSTAATPARIIAWAKPRLAVSSQAQPHWPARGPDPYEQAHVPLWRTFEEGAVILHSHRTGLVAETFCTGQRVVVRMGSGASRSDLQEAAK